MKEEVDVGECVVRVGIGGGSFGGGSVCAEFLGLGTDGTRGTEGIGETDEELGMRGGVSIISHDDGRMEATAAGDEIEGGEEIRGIIGSLSEVAVGASDEETLGENEEDLVGEKVEDAEKAEVEGGYRDSVVVTMLSVVRVPTASVKGPTPNTGISPPIHVSFSL